MSKLIQLVESKHATANVQNFPAFDSGDTVAVHVRIQEGAKSRIQVFQGTCIAIKERGNVNGHFRVRKISAGGIGVERVFPYHSPNVEKVEIVSRGKVRRAKQYYLRDRFGKAARIKVDYSRKD